MLLRLRMMMEGSENARNALGPGRVRKAREHADALDRMPKRGGEDLVEALELGRCGRGRERSVGVRERRGECAVDLDRERGGALRRESLGDCLHRTQRLGRHGARVEHRAQIGDLFG